MATKWLPSGTVNSYRVMFSDGSEPITVRNSIGDVIAWERANKTSWAEGMSVEAMLWVAWRAARREGLTQEPQFDMFVPRVDDIEVESSEPEDPTQTDPSDG